MQNYRLDIVKTLPETRHKNNQVSSSWCPSTRMKGRELQEAPLWVYKSSRRNAAGCSLPSPVWDFPLMLNSDFFSFCTKFEHNRDSEILYPVWTLLWNDEMWKIAVSDALLHFCISVVRKRLMMHCCLRVTALMWSYCSRWMLWQRNSRAGGSIPWLKMYTSSL